MNKRIYFDTETTGLNPVENDIIQIAGIIEIEGVYVEDFEFKIRPFNVENIDEKSLEIHKLSKEEIINYPSGISIYAALLRIFGKYVDKYNKNDKFIPCGYNVKFDIEFLNNFWLKCNDKYFGSWMTWHPMDALSIVQFLGGAGILQLPDYKLETVCNHFEIPIQAHDAMSDIKATRELIKILESKYIKAV